MNVITKGLIGSALALASVSTMAATITNDNPLRPGGGITIGNTTDVASECTPTYANCELQSIMNGLTGALPGGPINVNTMQQNAALFALLGFMTETTAPILRIEVTANYPSQIFGIFTDADLDSETTFDRAFAPIFLGSATDGASQLLTFDLVAKAVTIGTGVSAITYNGIDAGNFGFYLQPNGTANPTLYSSDAMNPNGSTQFLAFNLASVNRWYLAFEDVLRNAACTNTGSDCDHNDIIVSMESITRRVPEPGSLALLGLGLLALGAGSRRRAS